jgi:hypothetical protein
MVQVMKVRREDMLRLTVGCDRGTENPEISAMSEFGAS